MTKEQDIEKIPSKERLALRALLWHHDIYKTAEQDKIIDTLFFAGYRIPGTNEKLRDTVSEVMQEAINERESWGERYCGLDSKYTDQILTLLSARIQKEREKIENLIKDIESNAMALPSNDAYSEVLLYCV